MKVKFAVKTLYQRHNNYFRQFINIFWLLRKIH